MKQLHAGHFSFARKKKLVVLRYFWSKMNAQIKKWCELCEVCLTLSLSKCAPIGCGSSFVLDLQPMHEVSVNLFHSINELLLMTDRHSVCKKKLHRTIIEDVCKQLHV